jgi:hypothetical protein
MFFDVENTSKLGISKKYEEIYEKENEETELMQESEVLIINIQDFILCMNKLLMF